MKQRKVLVVEDELLVARVLKRVLEQHSFEVIQVSDEENAIRAAQEFIPDIIILDIHLKNKTSGITVGKEIRKRGVLCPIIFTTGNSFEQTKEQIQVIDNCHLFIKPVDTDQLIKYMQNIFRF
jgi:DNA-binding response OmpR family regulator